MENIKEVNININVEKTHTGLWGYITKRLEERRERKLAKRKIKIEQSLAYHIQNYEYLVNLLDDLSSKNEHSFNIPFDDYALLFELYMNGQKIEGKNYDYIITSVDICLNTGEVATYNITFDKYNKED